MTSLKQTRLRSDVLKPRCEKIGECIILKEIYFFSCQLISAQCYISHINQSCDLQCKPNDWFLYEMQHWAEMNEGKPKHFPKPSALRRFHGEYY